MYQKERMDAILDILKINGYVTVTYLTEKLHYSVATINRDLNLLEKQKLVVRSHGGVELVKRKSIPLPFRYHKMKTAKSKIAKRAADFVSDGDTIFVSATTTTEFMSKHLIGKKNITVITHNMAMVAFLSEYDVKVICLGGKVVDAPYILCDNDTVENAMKYSADKLFFSTGAITDTGIISSSAVYDLLYRVMVKNSKQIYYLVDHDKVNQPQSMHLFDLSHVDTVITDYIFSDAVKENYKNTTFIEVD